MASVQLRRVRSADPRELQRVVNTLVDMFLGNQTGRLNLDGDSGLTRALQGGATLASAVPAIQVRPASGEQAWLKHSDGATTVLRAQDAGLTVGVPLSGAGGAFSGNVTVGGTLSVGAAPASTGTIRLTDLGSVYAGTGNLRLIERDVANDINIGHPTDGASVRLFAGAAGVVNLAVGANLMIRCSSSGVGFNGTAGVAPPALASNATDLPTAITLVNDIKALLEDNGLAA
jgi:hypothetical protein